MKKNCQKLKSYAKFLKYFFKYGHLTIFMC